ncbi:MAG: hypothetical protein K0U79_14720 [Gammaproteobacteria bacterium]|nr:hypothetical protein [Gammaproteobacteria bacterium]
MKMIIFGFTAIALSVSTALLAEQAPTSEAHDDHGEMACCQKNEDGKMPCTMDHSQMGHGGMSGGQMDHEGMGMAHRSADAGRDMTHCGKTDDKQGHPAMDGDSHAGQGAADQAQHQHKSQ